MANNRENLPESLPRDAAKSATPQSKFKNSPQRGTDEGRKSGGQGSSAVPQDE